MRCSKCGSDLASFADLFGHPCQPKTISPLQREAEEEAGRKAHLRGLDRQIEMANERDFGQGKEQDNRFGDGSHVVVRETYLGGQEQILLDRTGSALLQEREAGGTPAFDASAEVPKDADERAEFRAREMRFPNEQRAALGERPWDTGMTTFLLTPDELAEYRRTGKLPEVSEDRRRHPDQERAAAALAKTGSQGPSL